MKAPVTFFVSSTVMELAISQEAHLLPATIKEPAHAGEIAHLVQTYLLLKSIGFDCTLSTKIPAAGIIVCHRKSFPPEFRPSKDQYIVYAKGDWDIHYFAQMHVTQNPFDMMQLNPDLWPRRYVPHYIQPGLMARANERGDVFANIAFVGDEDNLAEQLRAEEFAFELQKRGLNFRIQMHNYWHDYTQLDALVALRSLGNTQSSTIDKSVSDRLYCEKPATKLFNSWHANVPAILGVESGFRFYRNSELDYLEASTLSEVFAALDKLRQSPSLRENMRQNALKRRSVCSTKAICKAWRTILLEAAEQGLPKWCRASSADRNNFFRQREEQQRVFMDEKSRREQQTGKTLLMSYPM